MGSKFGVPSGSRSRVDALRHRVQGLGTDLEGSQIGVSDLGFDVEFQGLGTRNLLSLDGPQPHVHRSTRKTG